MDDRSELEQRLRVHASGPVNARAGYLKLR
jgi:hypothetical protein